MEEKIELDASATQPSTDGRLSYHWMGLAMLVFLLSQIALPSLIRWLYQQICSGQTIPTSLSMPLVYICMYLVGFPLMLLLLRQVPDCLPNSGRPIKQSLTPTQIAVFYVIGYALTSVVSITVTMIEQLLGTSATVTANDLAASDTSSLVFFVLGVFVAPIMEEIVFRYLPYRKLSGYGAKSYIIWSAIVFGIFHLNFGQSIYAALLGAFFAIIMYNTGSIKYSIILHVLINFSSGIGVGQLIIRSENTVLLALYGVVLLTIMISGVIFGVIFLVKKKFQLNDQTVVKLPLSAGATFQNIGSMIFLILCLGIIISGFFV